jgi:hypothetical protein
VSELSLRRARWAIWEGNDLRRPDHWLSLKAWRALSTYAFMGFAGSYATPALPGDSRQQRAQPGHLE